MTSSSSLSAIYRVVGVDFTVFGIVYPILPLYAHAIGLSVPAIGALLACYSLFQLVLAPTWGRVADRFGRRPVLLAALAGTFGSTVLIAIAHSPGLLFVALALNGASGGSMVVAQAAVIDVTEPEHRARAMGHVGAGIAIGFVVGPALAALSGIGGLRLPFIVASVLGGLNLIAAYRVFPETSRLARNAIARARESGSPPQREVRTPADRLALRRILGAVGLAAGAFGALETTFALIGRKHFGFGEAGAGLCFALLGVVMAAAQASGVGRSTKTLGKRVTVLLGGASFAIGILGIDLSHSYVILALGLVFAGLGYGLLSPVLTAAVANANSARRTGAAMGVQQAVGCLARIVGPLVAAAAYAGAGSTLVGLLGVLAVVVAVFLMSKKDVVSLVDRTSARPASLELGS